jgi:CheY-like chemotaxis protein
MTALSHNVLVVEDDAVLRNAICDLLRQEDIPVVCAEDGQDALDLLFAGVRPCLVLLDLQMPFVDGLNFRRQQLERPDLAAIPVVVVTAHPRKEKEARRLGVSAYMKKPIDPARLVSIVASHCAHAGPASLSAASGTGS